jgi:cell division septation protein DedD
MKLTCPRCGFENQLEETREADARLRACASCGADSDARARHAGRYDGYAVARRVLKFVPAWLLMCVVGFVVVLLLFKWAARPVVRQGGAQGDEFRNEATNQTPPPSPSDPHASAKPTERARQDAGRVPEPAAAEPGGAPATEVSDTKGVSETEEAASFSVQAGAFDDRSQANELVSRLRAAGFDARVAEAEDSRRFRFQVRSGLFQTREEAARLAAQLRAKGIGQTVIVEPSQK